MSQVWCSLHQQLADLQGPGTSSGPDAFCAFKLYSNLSTSLVLILKGDMAGYFAPGTFVNGLKNISHENGLKQLSQNACLGSVH